METYSPSQVENEIESYLNQRYNVVPYQISWSFDERKNLPYIYVDLILKDDTLVVVELENFTTKNRLNDYGRSILDKEVGVLKLLNVI